MANEVMPFKSYLMLMDESTWGTKNGSPERIYIPCDTYGVRFAADARQAKPFLGIKQRKHFRRYRGMPAGQATFSLYAFEPTPLTGTTSSDIGISLAEYLLDWCMVDEAGTIHEAQELPSKSAEWTKISGNSNIASLSHLGLRANQATLSGSADTGVVQLSIDLMGKDETDLTGTLTSPPDDMEQLVEMEFADVIFSLNDGAGGAVAAVPIDSFELQVQHALQVRYNNSRRPSLLLASDRIVTLNVTIDKTAKTYDNFMRNLNPDAEAIFAATLLVQGINNSTGAAAWTKGTLTFPAMEMQDNPETFGRDDIAQEQLSFFVTKPDTTGKDMSIAWTTGAAKT